VANVRVLKDVIGKEFLNVSGYKGLLEKWIVSICTAQKVHYKNTRCLKTINIGLGSTVVVLLSIAGANIFHL